LTTTVKAARTRKGSGQQDGSWKPLITPALKRFIQEQIRAFVATENAGRRRYIQHRGGPAGFPQVFDDRTIAFLDYTGHRWFLAVGKRAEAESAPMLLIDYGHRQWVKVRGGTLCRTMPN